MKTIELSEETGSLADYERDVGVEPAILTVDGRPVAALIPLENVDVETARLSMHPQFIELIERSRARHAREGGISSAEMRRRLETSRRRGK
jgi:antitoxin (DNA-binding transcriptional repressor) of toxin-antitoxin stability system